MAKSIYQLVLTNGEANAIFWHGHRYCFTNELSPHLIQDDNNGDIWRANLTEPEAWQLKAAWEKDGETLPCGSSDLVLKIVKFFENVI